MLINVDLDLFRIQRRRDHKNIFNYHYLIFSSAVKLHKLTSSHFELDLSFESVDLFFASLKKKSVGWWKICVALSQSNSDNNKNMSKRKKEKKLNSFLKYDRYKYEKNILKNKKYGVKYYRKKNLINLKLFLITKSKTFG